MSREKVEKSSTRLEKYLCHICRRKGEEITAIIFCSTCDEFQCEKCSKGHNIYKFLNHHDLQNVRDAKPLFVGLDRCETHNETIHFYCEDDDQLCCGTCAFLSHRDCLSVGEISRASRLADTDYCSLIGEFCDLQRSAVRARNHLQKTKKSLETQTAFVSKEIDRMAARIDMSFEQLSSNIEKEASAIEQLKTDEINAFQNNCELLLREITHYDDFITTLTKSGTPSQQFIAQYKLEEFHQILTERLQEESSKLEMLDFEIDLENGINKFNQCDRLLGNLRTSSIVENLISDSFEVFLELSGTVNISDLCAKSGDIFYTAMDFFQDRRLIAIEHRNKEMLLFGDNLQLIKSHKFINTPFSLVLVSQTEISVSLAGGIIEMYHISRKNDLILNRSIKTSVHCLCLCLLDNNTFAASYIDSRGIKTISNIGKENDIKFKTPLNPFSAINPTFKFIDNEEKIVTSNAANHTVSIYDTVKNTNVKVKDDRIKEPTWIAVGPSDSIFICNKCEFSPSIVQISSTGKIIASFDLGLYSPMSLCISADMKRLAVTSGKTGQQILNVYDIRY